MDLFVNSSRLVAILVSTVHVLGEASTIPQGHLHPGDLESGKVNWSLWAFNSSPEFVTWKSSHASPYATHPKCVLLAEIKTSQEVP